MSIASNGGSIIHKVKHTFAKRAGHLTMLARREKPKLAVPTASLGDIVMPFEKYTFCKRTLPFGTIIAW